MSRIRAFVLALSVVAIVIAGAGPAHARGPSPSEPASVTVTHRQAQMVAETGLREYLVVALPRPRAGKVGDCRGGPYLWRCPVRAHGSDTSCSATLAVWSDETTWYFELWHLECHAT